MLRDDSNLTASSLCRVRFLAWEQRDPRHDMFVVERWEIKKVRFEPWSTGEMTMDSAAVTYIHTCKYTYYREGQETVERRLCLLSKFGRSAFDFKLSLFLPSVGKRSREIALLWYGQLNEYTNKCSLRESVQYFQDVVVVVQLVLCLDLTFIIIALISISLFASACVSVYSVCTVCLFQRTSFTHHETVTRKYNETEHSRKRSVQLYPCSSCQSCCCCKAGRPGHNPPPGTKHDLQQQRP